jgi:hypothetical protein
MRALTKGFAIALAAVGVAFTAAVTAHADSYYGYNDNRGDYRSDYNRDSYGQNYDRHRDEYRRDRYRGSRYGDMAIVYGDGYYDTRHRWHSWHHRRDYHDARYYRDSGDNRAYGDHRDYGYRNDNPNKDGWQR